jgi:hypothetical protein
LKNVNNMHRLHQQYKVKHLGCFLFILLVAVLASRVEGADFRLLYSNDNLGNVDGSG